VSAIVFGGPGRLGIYWTAEDWCGSGERRRSDTPEVNCFGANLAVPEAGEACLGACGRGGSSSGIELKVLAEGAEDAGAGAEGHGCWYLVAFCADE
jgi:hypothetical protein